MRAFIPRLKDRLGARHARDMAIYAANASSLAIPAGETIVTITWLYHVCFDTAGNRFGTILYRSAPTDNGIIPFGYPGYTDVYFYSAGTYQTLRGPVLPTNVNCMLVNIADRDNTRAQMWLDGKCVADTALTHNPDLSANNGIYLNNWAATIKTFEQTCWRSLIMSLAAGQTPTTAQWSSILRNMRNPDAPIDPLLLSKVGALYSDYRPGEGIYGSTTITDNGTSGNNLTWQGATKVETVRTRQRVPWRKSKKTWYSLKDGYTAATAATDFGFAVQPLVLRAFCGERSAIPTANNYSAPGIIKAGTLDQIDIAHYLPSNCSYCAQAGGVPRVGTQETLHMGGGDTWIVCDGTTWYVIVNGQRIATPTALTTAIDLTGNCTVYLKYAAGDHTLVCRLAIWNPATVPTALEQEIRECVCDPDKDPPSLTNCRVDFKLNSDTLPLGTETTLANAGLGGGTLTLSAARSTSCTEMLRAASST